jgi:hypothetical protein
MHSVASVSPSSGRPPMNHAIADLGIPSAESRQTNNSVARLILIRSRAMAS